MTTLILTEDDPVWIIPGGGADVYITGTNGTDSLAVSNGADVTFSGSFNRGNDNIYIQGDSTDFKVSSSGVAVTFLSIDNQTEISISAGAVGQRLVFGDGSLDLKIVQGIMIGTQAVSAVSSSLTAPVNPNFTSDDYFSCSTNNGNYTSVSLDVGSSSQSVNFDAESDGFKYTDDASILTNVRIVNFSQDDVIEVSNAKASDYSITNTGSDVTLEYNNNGLTNTIVLVNVVDSQALIFDEASFEDAVGFDAFNALGGGTEPEPEFVLKSADVGSLTDPVTMDAGGDSFKFTDDANVSNVLIIDNFSDNDQIEISNAVLQQYSFSNDGEDVRITCTDGGIVNEILLTGVVDSSDLVYDEASFTAAIGFNAVSFA